MSNATAPDQPAESMVGWVTLPDDTQLHEMGHRDGAARAQRPSQRIDDLPARAYWLLDIGAVLVEGLYPAYGRAQRETVPLVGRTTAGAALATTVRAEDTAEARARQGDLDELETTEPPADPRFGYLRRLSGWPYVGFLAGLGVAETLFNVSAFEITGEDPWRVAVMAGLVGLSSAMSGHLLGSSLQELSLDNADDDARLALRRHALVRGAVGVCLAMFMLAGFFAVANLRATFFTYKAQQQQADAHIEIAGLPSPVTTVPAAVATTAPTMGNDGTADSVPEISWVAPFALNLMVWAVAIAAGYHHASVHHHARRHLRRDRDAADKKHCTSRAKEGEAIAAKIASLSHAIEAVGNALSEVLKQAHLTNAAVKFYLASYLAELDRAGVDHFDIGDVPRMELPAWTKDAQQQLEAFGKARDEHLRILVDDYPTTAAAASIRFVGAVGSGVAAARPGLVAEIDRNDVEQAA